MLHKMLNQIRVNTKTEYARIYYSNFTTSVYGNTDKMRMIPY